METNLKSKNSWRSQKVIIFVVKIIFFLKFFTKLMKVWLTLRQYLKYLIVLINLTLKVSIFSSKCIFARKWLKWLPWKSSTTYSSQSTNWPRSASWGWRRTRSTSSRRISSGLEVTCQPEALRSGASLSRPTFSTSSSWEGSLQIW